jgi:hypothetical protein
MSSLDIVSLIHLEMIVQMLLTILFKLYDVDKSELWMIMELSSIVSGMIMNIFCFLGVQPLGNVLVDVA